MVKTEIDDKTFITESLMAIKREGMEDLIAFMDDCGFFDAPCSTTYHLCSEGGLAEHTRNVMEMAEKVGVSLYGGKEYNKIHDTVVLSAALHDLGKMGQFDKPLYIPNLLKNGELGSKPYKSNPDLLNIPHEVRSVVIASMFIDLTEEEQFAILYHNGLYGDFKHEIPGKETPLYLIIHFADMWASHVIEKEEK